ncbi:phosphatidylinositol/phosphatidylcholine transfer protein SFH11-like [Gossypium australe]|uniref:Phosphatidylinositol/phosphatidylcholine transfer protein SFH11-like n=1 Tax=Gossypium australe TaxID=47621 RepID=A0A5B6UF90_9ROSI|nr:phosphatidylinositol/phosphatidylcholine transfer protein SFH11-like [Gossypium australe]
MNACMTIKWRETYRILSPEELETWANMVFWHGYDLMHRPCLIVRLGLACSCLPSHDRPRFAQAVSTFLSPVVLLRFHFAAI